MTKQLLFEQGSKLALQFCELNDIRPPAIAQLTKRDRLYHLATCAYYRPEMIRVMVEKCASPGMGGRAWSWPGYVIDRTPYGVVQHELGHHVDHFLSEEEGRHAARNICEMSGEKPLTGYLGTDTNRSTYYSEWFAENFRLFVTNPSLCGELRPVFHTIMTANYNFRPVVKGTWQEVLVSHNATPRIFNQAQKKVEEQLERITLMNSRQATTNEGRGPCRWPTDDEDDEEDEEE